jgi:hypothetical protein
MEEPPFHTIARIFFVFYPIVLVPNMVTSHLPFVSVKAKPLIPKMTYMAGHDWFAVFEQNLLSHHQSLLLIILGYKTLFFPFSFFLFFFSKIIFKKLKFHYCLCHFV